MPAARRVTTEDQRAARTQLKTADPEARVAKSARAKDNPASTGGFLTIPIKGKSKDEDGTVTEVSQEIRLADEVGIMPLMEWAASSDVDVASADGLRAVYHVLQDAIHEDQWAEFRRFARDHKLSADTLLDFTNSALEALAGRPTEEPSGS